MAETSNWKELLEKTNAQDISRLKGKPIVALKTFDPLSKALKVLAENNILSAPVFDHELQFRGFLDLLDVAGYALNVWKLCNVDQPTNLDPSHKFFETHIKEVINFSLWNYPVAVSQNSSLKDSIETLLDPNRHFKPHRLCVLDNQMEVKNIISQFDIISFVWQHHNIFPRANKTLKELGLIRPVISVRLDASFSDALHVLFDNRVSGVALLDYEGRVCGNFSASDLRGILPEAFDMFSGSILQFLCKGTLSAPSPPKTSTSKITLKDCLRFLVTEHIHRVYIVDESDRPVGIVTLTDILRILL